MSYRDFLEDPEPGVEPCHPLNQEERIALAQGIQERFDAERILGDKSTNGGNVLTLAVLSKLPKFDGQKVICCAGCLIGSDRRNAKRIVIRQTPYKIKVS